jgi:hypothetical protein
MREVGMLLWWSYITGMTVYSWFTSVESVEEFFISLMAWFILSIIPIAIFPD